MKAINFHISTASEDSLLINFDAATLDTKNQLVCGFVYWANTIAPKPNWLVELVPSYSTVLIVYDMLMADEHQVKSWLLSADLSVEATTTNEQIALPVCYQLNKSNDLQRVASHANCSVQDVIKSHTSTSYRVYAIGFAPGFAYLGQCEKKIETPRLSTPRKRVEQGAVAIADRQTAVYPFASPGGWNILGYCPLTLFDVNRHPATPFSVGAQVSFYAVPEAEYRSLVGKHWFDVDA